MFFFQTIAEISETELADLEKGTVSKKELQCAGVVNGIVNAKVLILLPQLPRRNYWTLGLILHSGFYYRRSDISNAAELSENYRTKIGRFIFKPFSGYRACVPQG